MDPGQLGELVNFGALGIVLLALIMGWLVPGRSYDREAQRADRLETELRELSKHLSDHVLPLLARAAELIEFDRDRRRREAES